MKKIFLPFLFLAISSLTFLNSCNDSSVINDPGTETQNTLLLTSSTGGILTFDNYSMTILPGTVPKTQTGGDGQVTFSIETKTTLESGIASLPSGYTLVGKYVKFGPEGFIYSYPIKMSFPASSESSPELLVVMRYYPDRNEWFRVNTTEIDLANKIVSTNGDSLKLGYFALAKTTVKDALDSQGGIEFTGQPDYWYTLTVKSCTLTYPGQGAWFSGGSPVGYTFSSGSDATVSNPLSPMHAYLPQGTYVIWLSRINRTNPLQTFSTPYNCNISGPLNYSGWGSPSGWANLTDPGGGTWVSGPPQTWPAPTVPLGTGKFQATLTWVNGPVNATDLDLRLLMPSGEEINFGHRIASDSSFALDKDMKEYDLGDCIENIFSLKSTLPLGAYRVKVRYYAKTLISKQFNSRILLNGSVTNYSGALTSVNQEIIVYTFTL